MIKQLRIDDRLIHGEVVVMWVGFLGVDTIVVANDKTATNKMLTMTMNLAKPRGTELKILTLSDAATYLNDTTNEKKKIFVIVENAYDAVNLVKACAGIEEVNIGAMRSSPGKKQVNLKVFVDDKDIAELKEIENLGRKIYQQTKPDQKQVSLKELISKV